jgi:hypothetical protein
MALTIAEGYIPLQLSCTPLTSGVAHTPKDGIPTISVWIVGRTPLPPDIRRLRLRALNIARQHRRPARLHVAPLRTNLRPLNLPYNHFVDA